MSTFLQDTRYAIRTLFSNPGFTGVAVLTLALGIGANTTFFSLFNAIFLRPPPVENPDRLVEIFTSDDNGDRFGPSSYFDYLDIQARNDVFTDVTAFSSMPVSISRDGGAVRGNCALVAGDYFPLLGIHPFPGRGFTPDETNETGAAPVAVLSYGLWQRLFGGDPDIIGGSIILNGQPFTVIGIAPRSFTGMQRGAVVDVWAPLTMERQIARLPFSRLDRRSRWLSIIGRLNPETTVAQAQTQMDRIAARLQQTYPDVWAGGAQKRFISVVPEYQRRTPMRLRDDIVDFMAMMMGVMGVVLLIACANVANLTLVRTLRRRHEIAIRIALGAGRRKLMRQLLTESLLLSALAGAAGLLLALWSADLLVFLQPALPVPLELDFSLDDRVLMFAAGITVLTGVLFGLAPALQASGRNPMPALKADPSLLGSTAHTSKLRNAFIIVQIALSMLVLIGAGLFLRSLQQAYTVDLGFDPNGVLLLSVDLHQQGYDDTASRTFYINMLDRIQGMRGVESVSLAATLPLGGGPGRTMLSVDTDTPDQAQNTEIHMNLVGPGYFTTMRASMIQGRDFNRQDQDGQTDAIIVNETFVEQYLPDQDPVGLRLRLDNEQRGPAFEIIGVVRNSKYASLDEAPAAQFYLPVLQNTELLQTLPTGMTVLVRTSDDPLAMANSIQREIQGLDSRLPVFNIKTLDTHVSIVYLPIRIGVTILGLFGGLALLLAAIGLYGVLAYTVSQRTYEIGVRMALGAQPRDILILVIRQGMLLAAWGIGAGLAAAFVSTRYFEAFLYDTSPTDPLTFCSVVLLLSGIAFLASYLPARRATRLAPMEALRYE